MRYGARARDADAGADLLRRADVGMHEAKRAGKQTAVHAPAL